MFVLFLSKSYGTKEMKIKRFLSLRIILSFYTWKPHLSEIFSFFLKTVKFLDEGHIFVSGATLDTDNK